MKEILSELLLKWEEKYEAGEDIPASKLCEDFPELTEQLQTKITALKEMAWLDDGSSFWV